ncbi:hypothetical protein BpHYR1_019391 [Brachionus plicatilis]|uniref:Uncharacterized protein n=1 Tax=Brachionus plicatilis TaxID=10195 RepID=A0A3M7RW04_BRAPC|nr:hypothetical protein BpHYR1_019391 [Brachionus plicatilis]
MDKKIFDPDISKKPRLEQFEYQDEGMEVGGNSPARYIEVRLLNVANFNIDLLVTKEGINGIIIIQSLVSKKKRIIRLFSRKGYGSILELDSRAVSSGLISLFSPLIIRIMKRMFPVFADFISSANIAPYPLYHLTVHEFFERQNDIIMRKET